MLVPETLKAKPSDNYDDLKRQFFALKSLCESKIKECSIYSNRLAEYDRESVIARSEALESEKEMNAQLTLELEKANERVAELEKCCKLHTLPPNVVFDMVEAMLPQEVNKFAIEQQIKGADYVIETVLPDPRTLTCEMGLLREDMLKAKEQLHKEQDSE